MPSDHGLNELGSRPLQYPGNNLPSLFSRLSSKIHSTIGPGWVKYEYNGGFWDLNDEADYSIFAWRLAPADAASPSPVIFVHDPLRPLPLPPAYQNMSYYAFRPKHVNEASSSRASDARGRSPRATGVGPAGPFVPESPPIVEQDVTVHRQETVIGRAKSVRSAKSRRSRIIRDSDDDDESAHRSSRRRSLQEDKVPKYKRDFLKFHGENGNRVVVGTFGPVQKVEMLLKKGYRHVYMSRHFAKRHGLVPPEVVPGWMGYGGLVNMGQIPIKLGTKQTTHTVYLAEENQFDVVLGRSFMEARRVQTDPTDPSNVTCGDNGDKLEVKIIVIKDGRGDTVLVP